MRVEASRKMQANLCLLLVMVGMGGLMVISQGWNLDKHHILSSSAHLQYLPPPWDLDNCLGGMSTTPPRDAGVLEIAMSSQKFPLHNSHQHEVCSQSCSASSLQPSWVDMNQLLKVKLNYGTTETYLLSWGGLFAHPPCVLRCSFSQIFLFYSLKKIVCVSILPGCMLMYHEHTFSVEAKREHWIS